MISHRGGLWVVDDDEVVLALQPGRVELVVAPVNLLLLLAQALRIALERVVNRLRHIEELVRAVDDPPLRLEPGVGHQRNERVVDLGDAAAERRCREVQHPLARQRLGQAADLLHQSARRQRRVVAKRLVADVDLLEHRSPAGRCAEVLDEAQARATSFARLDLELVGERPDNGDAEPALAHPVGL